ncbi:hypothetical protein Desde_3532 [Desulfitobacterium dehalogenans ATCC 51507]|uniref:Flagellar protein FliT n=1 Tax=Desulfitobacterium dehalogenans (strain ATCC 51507 / DSM 9161 / JW/IU-DC1) TaxID=756499 RepID=I4ACX9_DESDJ|nr:hypothetical protein [Desulfitobacterium dehalogenans]AFM01814.1 hypothetical protein Desde_3532 [Desulfitobacterium dehalogenans ATCC 51507]
MTEKTPESLWQDYLFLTKEMLKFLDKKDMELFHDLMSQRERMQTLIEETPDQGFRSSPEGRKLLTEIQGEDQILMSHFQATHSKAKHHHQVAEAYSGGNQRPVNHRNWVR